MRVVRLILDNQTVIVRHASSKTIRCLESVTSYLVAGYFHSPAYKSRRWDGREHLLTFRRGRYRAPIGLLAIIKREMESQDTPYEVKRRKQSPPPSVEFDWNPDVILRPYQRKAMKLFCRAPERGRGILKMPIRSGKTKTAAGIIHKLGVRAMFLVPSQMLLHQTAKSLAESLPGAKIGIIGDGQWSEGDVTVATIQTLGRLRGGTKHQCKGNKLRDASGNPIDSRHEDKPAQCGRKKCAGAHRFIAKADPRYLGIIEGYGLVIFDECHHLRGDSWHGVMVDFNCRYRLGLSATVFFKDKSEQERGVIWLRACCGEIKHEVSTSRLIEKGYLMRQHVEIYKVTQPNKHDKGWSQELKNECIYENEWRNALIIKLTKEKLEKHHRNVMIVTNRKNQIHHLVDIMEKAKMDFVVLTGDDSTQARDDRVDMFKRDRVRIILGTVFGEGIDIPEVEVVVNAEGGKDAKATIQRMRNLTPSEGKGKAVLIDFWDDTNGYFRRHSNARVRTYQSEKAFIVQKMWMKKTLV